MGLFVILCAFVHRVIILIVGISKTIVLSRMNAYNMVGILFLLSLSSVLIQPSDATETPALRGLLSENLLVRAGSHFQNLCQPSTIANQHFYCPSLLALQSGSPPATTRVINGDDVSDDRFPYFSMMWGHALCGGALIGPDLVISAAHVSSECRNEVFHPLPPLTDFCSLTLAVQVN